MGAQGHFILLETHPDGAPSLGARWLEQLPPELCMPQSWRRHVTVYSSSRWFLQI